MSFMCQGFPLTGATINQTPEQIAWDRIDDRLRAAGWGVQPATEINHAAAPGIAVRECQTTVGPADYALFGNRKPLGVVEAKPNAWGERITTVEQQSAAAQPKSFRSALQYLLPLNPDGLRDC